MTPVVQENVVPIYRQQNDLESSEVFFNLLLAIIFVFLLQEFYLDPLPQTIKSEMETKRKRKRYLICDEATMLTHVCYFLNQKLFIYIIKIKFRMK